MKKTINFALLLLLILVSGLATRFFRDVSSLLIIFAVASFYLLCRERTLNMGYVASCAVWFCYAILSYVKYPGNNLFWPLLYFCNITIAYAVVRKYGESFIVFSTDVLFFLTVLSIVLFVFQLIALDPMLAIWQQFDLSEALFDKPYTHYAHTFLYTIHQFKDTEKGAARNAGFCWEPGAFACFLVIGVYFQLLRDGYKIGSNKIRYLTFLLAILTTQSTTGLVGLFVIVVWYLSSQPKGQYAKYGFMAILIASPLLALLPQQFEKIESQLSDDLLEQVLTLDENENEKGLGRFQSIIVLGVDFFDNPILGLGANKADSWVSRMGLDVNATSGIGHMFATYGIFLMVPYLWLLYRSGKVYCQVFMCKGAWVFPVLMIVLGFSFSVLETPFFLTAAFYGAFNIKFRGI